MNRNYEVMFIVRPDMVDEDLNKLISTIESAVNSVSIDTAKNQPDIHRKKQLKWDRPHGTRVEMEMEGHYQKGPHSVEVYLKQTAIANPHLTIVYKDPHGEEIRFARSIKKLPARPVEIKPHPYGIELGRLIQMLNNTKSWDRW